MKKLIVSLSLLLTCAFSFAQTPVRVLTYNVLNFPNPTNTNTDGNDASRLIKFRQIIDEANPDIIVLQEIKTSAGIDMLLAELNDNGTLGLTYGRATNFTAYGPNDFMLGNGFIYNTAKIDFVSQAELPRNNTATAADGTVQRTPRAISQYNVNIKNSLCADELVPLTVFSAHLKAGIDAADSNEISDEDRRNLGSLDMMDVINSLATTDNVIAVGDFNFQDETEIGYQTLVDGTNTVACRCRRCMDA